MISIPTILCIIIVILTYLVLPLLAILTIKNRKTLDIIAIISVIFFAIILAICVFSSVDIDKQNVIFRFINDGKWCNANIDFSFKSSTADYLINIAMLFPIGAVIMTKLSKNNKNTFLKTICISLTIGLCIGLFIETMQFILPVIRSVQLSDVILNGISCLLGTIFYYFIFKFRNKIVYNKSNFD